jgi:hypothetical protein
MQLPLHVYDAEVIPHAFSAVSPLLRLPFAPLQKVEKVM